MRITPHRSTHGLRARRFVAPGRIALGRIALGLVALMIGVAACDRGGGGAKTTSSSGQPTVAPGDGSGLVAGSVASLDNVRTALVSITANGRFIDVDGTTSTSRAGSGFVIERAGLAVTAQHVVSGATSVLVVGSDGLERPARVIATSECSDLAVIQIAPTPDSTSDSARSSGAAESTVSNGASSWPFLAFTDSPAKVGDQVYAADLTNLAAPLTTASIDAIDAAGDTPLSSIARLFRYNARVNPEQAGSAVVDGSGRVAGVSVLVENDDGGHALPTDLAMPVLQSLRDGKDVLALGMNVVATADPATGESGLFVGAVRPASLAARVGIQAGDLVTRLDGDALAFDGTLRDYCGVLARHQLTDQLSVRVARTSGGAKSTLEGTINGAPLKEVDPLSDRLRRRTGPDLGIGGSTSDYVTVADDSGAVQVRLPRSWSERRLNLSDLGTGLPTPTIVASPNLVAYSRGFDAPGTQISLVPENVVGDVDAVLDAVSLRDQCTSAGREPYADPVFQGKYEIFTGCGANKSVYVWMVASPTNNATVATAKTRQPILIGFQLLTQGDLDVFQTVLGTFDYVRS